MPMNPIWLLAFIPLAIVAGWFFRSEQQRKEKERLFAETEYVLHRLKTGDWK
jgi:hypothetical protein